MNAANTLLDAYDAAEMLLLSTRQVRLLVKQGQLPHVVLPDGELRFVEADLLAWIELHKKSGQEAAPCR